MIRFIIQFPAAHVDIHGADILDLDEFIEDIHFAILVPVKAGAREESR